MHLFLCINDRNTGVLLVKNIINAWLLIVISSITGIITWSAHAEEASAQELAQANNPLASMKTFNLHNYYTPTLTGLPDETANTFWLRYAQPVGKFLVRASLPFPTQPVAGQVDSESGMGDLNAFAAYLAVSKPEMTFGVGPIITAPTATDDALGTGKWQGGVAAVLFGVPSPQFQYGGLVTWQGSFAGDDDRDDTSALAVQPFGIWQMGSGFYLRSTGIWAFNIETGDYNVPFGLGIGKVVKVGKTVFNIFAEPQYTILHNGIGQPEVQFFIGLNTQFTSQ